MKDSYRKGFLEGVITERGRVHDTIDELMRNFAADDKLTRAEVALVYYALVTFRQYHNRRYRVLGIESGPVVEPPEQLIPYNWKPEAPR